jgi:inosine-uridine nucleoside N-ribohydrolase
MNTDHSDTALNLILDLETADPDDVLTLTLAAAHPRIRLLAALVTPGTPAQIAVVRTILAHILPADRLPPIGAFDLRHGHSLDDSARPPPTCVSDWHYKAFAHIGLVRGAVDSDAPDGWRLLDQHWTADVTLVTGAPLKNLGAFLRNVPPERLARVGSWIAQGGFAGANVVPPELRLPQFGDKDFFQTFNFGGDIPSAVRALACAELRGKTWCVSKNVCHRVVFAAKRLEELSIAVEAAEVEVGDEIGGGDGGGGGDWRASRARSLRLVHAAMAMYLEKNSKGKKFHDPLALAAALERGCIRWAPVRVVHRPKEGFGCEVSDDNADELETTLPHRISIDCDEDAAFRVLFETTTTRRKV